MQKTITFESGIKNTPYDNSCLDGELKRAEGVEFHGGSMRPAMLCGENVVIPDGWDLLYVHKTSEYEHWLMCKANTKVHWVNRSDLEAITDRSQMNAAWLSAKLHQVSVDWVSGMKMANVGNAVAITTPGVEIRYIVWKDGAYQYRGSMPKPKVRFEIDSPYVQEFVVDASDVVMTDISFAWGGDNNNKTKIYIPNASEESLSAIASAWTEMNKHSREHNTFVRPFMVRYAVKMNGSDDYYYLSNPILMEPTNGAPFCWFFKDDRELISFDSVHGDERKQLRFMMAYGHDPEGDITVGQIESNLIANIDNLDDLLEWKDDIKCIDVFVTDPIRLFDIDGRWITTKNPDFLKSPISIQHGDETVNLYDYTAGMTSSELIEMPWLDEQMRNDTAYASKLSDQSDNIWSEYSLGSANMPIENGNPLEKCRFSAAMEWMMYLMHMHSTGGRGETSPYYGLNECCIIKPNGIKSEYTQEDIESKINDGMFFKFASISAEQLADSVRLKATKNQLGDEGREYCKVSSLMSDETIISGTPFVYNNRLNISSPGISKQLLMSTDQLMDDVKSNFDAKYDAHQNTVGTYQPGTKYNIQKVKPFSLLCDNYFSSDTRKHYYFKMTNPVITKHKEDLTVTAYVYLKNEGLTIVKKLDDLETAYNHGVNFLYYPSENAEKIVLYCSGTDGKKLKLMYPLTNIKSGGYSYWCRYCTDVTVVDATGSTEEDREGSAYTDQDKSTLDGNVSENSIYEKRDNYIYTSEAENPYEFNYEGVNRIGTGEIKGIGVQKVAISTGQFGTAPLVVMCTDGNFAMSVSTGTQQTGLEAGLFYDINPMAGELLKGENVVMTEDSMIYVCDGGVAVLSGNDGARITSALEGVGSFSQWVDGATPVYDYQNKRLLLMKEGESLVYIMNMETKAWTTMKLPGMVMSNVVNRYPDPIVIVTLLDNDGEETDNRSAIVLNDIYEYLDDENTYVSTIETRPIKLDSEQMKKLDQMVVNGHVSGEVETEIMGSNDLDTWHSIGKTKRMRVPHIAGKYYKYWKLVLKVKMGKEDNLTAVTLRWTERTEEKLR